jgi:hypothetical protein
MSRKRCRIRKRQTGHQETKAKEKYGKYGRKLWCKRLHWYECENEKDERIRVNAETSEEEYVQANKDTEGKGN